MKRNFIRVFVYLYTNTYWQDHESVIVFVRQKENNDDADDYELMYDIA